MPEYLNSDQFPDKIPDEWTEALPGILIHAKTAAEIMKIRRADEEIAALEELFSDSENDQQPGQ
jgi:hypothetical protein